MRAEGDKWIRSIVIFMSISYVYLFANRHYKSIVDDQYRKKMAKGDILIKGSAISEKYKLIISKKIPNHVNKINQQSKDVIDVLKNL